MIQWKEISFAHGDQKILEKFNLTVEPDQTTVLLGPSGSGKTTLLHLAAELLSPASGTIIKSVAPLSYLFQSPRLLPWKSLKENITFVLDDAMDAAQKQGIAEKVIAHVGLEGFEDFLPHQLSGGMAQRCAIARAFAATRRQLLMDEPFKGLDLKLKLPLIKLLSGLIADSGTLAVLVTHDVREAIFMADRIVFLDGPPLKIVADIKGLEPDQRHINCQAFYDLEKQLYALILGDEDLDDL